MEPAAWCRCADQSAGRHVGPSSGANEQKFFGSFFQKRTAFFF
jgi:hypothetical protein